MVRRFDDYDVRIGHFRKRFALSLMMRFFLLVTSVISLLCAAAAAAPKPLAARKILGARIVAAGGVPVGQVSDLLCDTSHGRIADLVVSRGQAQVAIRWAPLPQALPGPIRVSTAVLAQSEPVGDAIDSDPALRAVEHGLIGQAVISADGTPLGHIAGLRIDPRSGAVADVQIAETAGQAAREVPWSAIADIDLSPIVLDLDAQQVAASSAGF